MCTTFSTLHGIVDGTLAFVVSELGEALGSWSSFLLYIFFTVSALFLAKPLLYTLGPKASIQLGSRCLFCYVLSFFVALMCRNEPKLQWSVFLIGGCVGGIGAGVLWSGQGTYFTLNALRYADLMGLDPSIVTAWFASIFATMYLGMETIFKGMTSFVFFASGWDEWLPLTFGVYIVVAVIAMEVFRVTGKDLKNADISRDEDKVGSASTSAEDAVEGNEEKNGTGAESSVVEFNQRLARARSEAAAVIRLILSNRKIQLLLPFQMCFGLSTGLFAFFVNARVVSDHIGSGYIGLLSALATLCACMVGPLSGYIASNQETLPYGRFTIMVMGGLCYVMQGLTVLSASTSRLSVWSTVVFLYMIHGISRGIWECTNKEEVARAFHDSQDLPTAFAALYVTSGGSTAFGFVVYQYCSRELMGTINFIVAIVAVASYCYFKVFVEESGVLTTSDIDHDLSVHSIKALSAVMDVGGDNGEGGPSSSSSSSPSSSSATGQSPWRGKAFASGFSRGRERVQRLSRRDEDREETQGLTAAVEDANSAL